MNQRRMFSSTLEHTKERQRRQVPTVGCLKNGSENKFARKDEKCEILLCNIRFFGD